jgi:hypothetical protein
MDGTPNIDDTQEWDDIEEELTSTLREVCSFSFQCPGENRTPATAFAAVRDRPRRVVPRQPVKALRTR